MTLGVSGRPGVPRVQGYIWGAGSHLRSWESPVLTGKVHARRAHVKSFPKRGVKLECGGFPAMAAGLRTMTTPCERPPRDIAVVSPRSSQAALPDDREYGTEKSWQKRPPDRHG